MKTIIAILLCIFISVVYVESKVVLDQAVEEEWEAFKIKHGKEYNSPEEEMVRKVIFSEHLFKIAEHNRFYAKGTTTYSMAVNKFSDLTEEEMLKYKGFKRINSVKSIRKVNFVPKVRAVVPDKIDWRALGAVTEVKDQGNCGSCWAFSAIGGLEALYFRKTGKLVDLSEQNLIDCSNQGINKGCDGGDPTDAFDYVYLNGGIESEHVYPYVGKNEVCHYNASENVTSIRFFGDVEGTNEDYLKEAVATIGPVSVDIYTDDSFTNYEAGVYYNGCCKEDEPNHSVLVVGYGSTNDEVDYWVVKNSWGKDWGEDGYVRMARNEDNNCGIASTPSFPIM